MNLLPVHIPSRNFIILNNYEEVEREELMEFTFYGKDEIMTNYSCLLGRFIGSFHEESFQTKLWKVRGLMHVKGIRFSECVSRPFWTKESIAKTDQQKYQKMYTQNYNKYQSRLQAIKTASEDKIKKIHASASLFMADEIEKEWKDMSDLIDIETQGFAAIVNKLKQRYNQP